MKMKNYLYVIYDAKSESYMGPHANRTMGEAIRAFSDAVNDPETMLYKHPEDYTLMEVATFNLDSGMISAYDAKKPVTSALDCKKQQPLDLRQQSLPNIA